MPVLKDNEKRATGKLRMKIKCWKKVRVKFCVRVCVGGGERERKGESEGEGERQRGRERDRGREREGERARERQMRVSNPTSA